MVGTMNSSMTELHVSRFQNDVTVEEYVMNVESEAMFEFLDSLTPDERIEYKSIKRSVKHAFLDAKATRPPFPTSYISCPLRSSPPPLDLPPICMLPSHRDSCFKFCPCDDRKRTRMLWMRIKPGRTMNDMPRKQ